MPAFPATWFMNKDVAKVVGLCRQFAASSKTSEEPLSRATPRLEKEAFRGTPFRNLRKKVAVQPFLGVTSCPPSRTPYTHDVRIFYISSLSMLFDICDQCCYQRCVTPIEIHVDVSRGPGEHRGNSKEA